MADFVLDASFALTWCFQDEVTAITDAQLDALINGAIAIAPPIWPLEVANAIRTAERRGRLRSQQTDEFMDLVCGLPIEIAQISSTHTFRSVFRLAQEQGLTVYDASYLYLAAEMNLPLATLDRLLRSSAVRIGVRLVDGP